MELLEEISVTERYKVVTKEKSSGATYTPKNLADFVAQQIIATVRDIPTNRPLRLLEPDRKVVERYQRFMIHCF